MQRNHCNQSLGSPWEINSKYNEHKAGMNLISLILKRWAHQDNLQKDKNEIFVGILVVVIDVNPSHGVWTTILIKVFGHEGQFTCIYNTHEWIVYIVFFMVVCGTSRGSSWLRINEFLKMTK
jgi:predicted transglutaminase-like protease